MNLFEAVNYFYKKAQALNEPNQSVDPSATMPNQSTPTNVPFYEKYPAPKEEPQANWQPHQAPFVNPLKEESKPKPSPTVEQVTNWQISQVNKLKSKIYDEKFTAYSESDAKNMVSLVSSLVKRYTSMDKSSSEAAKIKDLIDIVEGMSDSVFPASQVAPFNSLKQSIKSSLSSGQSPALKNQAPISNSKPLPQGAPASNKKDTDGTGMKPLDYKSPGDGPPVVSARVNLLRKLLK